jgi:hypothetical protein
MGLDHGQLSTHRELEQRLLLPRRSLAIVMTSGATLVNGWGTFGGSAHSHKQEISRAPQRVVQEGNRAGTASGRATIVSDRHRVQLQ